MAAKVTTTGGKRFGEILKKAPRGGKAVEFGILPEATRYDDGVHPALVGILHEFGLAGHRESAWFRSAVVDIRDELKKKKIQALARGGLTDRDAEQIAALAVDKVRDSLRAAGLVDTTRLISSIASRIVKI